MPEKLKDIFFTGESVGQLADHIGAAYPDFDREQFLGLVFDDAWESRELKDRMRHVAHCLHEALPQDYPKALEILKAAAPSIRGFEAISLPEFVGRYGLGHWDLSLPALAFFTRFGSSEYGIRPFLKQDPQRAMEYMLRWADDPSEHVRRLASEGCRPRLPWGMGLAAFKKDPSLILPVLEKLKNDESEYVRKSVANNLNDISKDHPDVVLDTCERWYGHSKRTDWIERRALRTLLKAGNRRALLLFGFADLADIHVEDLTLDRARLQIGDVLQYSFQLRVDGEEPRKIRLELGIDYVKKRGRLSRKVFAIEEDTFAPGTHLMSRKARFADQSTRKHNPGEHHITILVNGVEKATASFELTP
jgi:3-methyladenine DNA glycosylase AlkC